VPRRRVEHPRDNTHALMNHKSLIIKHAAPTPLRAVPNTTHHIRVLDMGSDSYVLHAHGHNAFRLCFAFIRAHEAAELRLDVVVGVSWSAHAVMKNVVVAPCQAHNVVCSWGSPRVQGLAAPGIATMPVALGEGEDDVDLRMVGGVCLRVSVSVW
jgi:hypothetical protein